MKDSAPSQIKHIFAHTTVAGASALPVPNVHQSMFHGHTLTQFRTPLRRLLAFPQLLQQGFIGMNADAAARGARGTPRSQGTMRTRGRGKLHHAAGLKRHRDAARTLQDVLLPIQREGSFGKKWPLLHRPSLAENGMVFDEFRKRTGVMIESETQINLLIREEHKDIERFARFIYKKPPHLELGGMRVTLEKYGGRTAQRNKLLAAFFDFITRELRLSSILDKRFLDECKQIEEQRNKAAHHERFMIQGAHAMRDRVFRALSAL